MSSIQKVLATLGQELAKSSQSYRAEVPNTIFSKIEDSFNSQLAFAEVSEQDRKTIEQLNLKEAQDITAILKKNKQLLSSAGIDYGHLISNLVLYTQDRLKKAAQQQEFLQLNDEDKELLAKAVRLIEAYLSVLKKIDSIDSPQALEEFLGFKGRGLITKTSFKQAINASGELAPYASKAKEVLGNEVVEINIDSTLTLSRYLNVSTDTANLTLELRRFNTFKGTFASNVRNAFLISFNKLLNDPKTDINKQLIQGIKGSSAKAIRDNFDALIKSTASKDLFTALEDMFVSVARTGVAKPYRSKGITKPLDISAKLPKIKLPSIKVKIPKAPPAKLRTKTGQFYNLISLQNLINQSLVERVKQNMGRGDRRDILNLRSGRFAESVKVERMTQSREGMITAFYSYMKNPYATFSEGGLQSSPRTRDPKLLIARSIRDIASQQVQNRLRSVSV